MERERVRLKVLPWLEPGATAVSIPVSSLVLVVQLISSGGNRVKAAPIASHLFLFIVLLLVET